MLEDEKIKIINFLQDFGCATIKQLQILYNKPRDNFRDILTSNLVSKKGDILIHNNSELNIKTIYALDVLCKYKGRFKQFHKGYDPVYLTFLTKDNTLYNIIVTDKKSEQGVLKLLRTNSPYIPEADKFIILFEDAEYFGKIESKTPFVYCIYPELKIINKKLSPIPPQ